MREVTDQRAVGGRAATSLSRGFTLLELLVAMAILLIIVMIVAQLFQQARQVVDTGSRRAEMNMKGRAAVDFMAQELSMAIRSTKYANFEASGNKATFWMLGDATNETRAVQEINYEFVGSTSKKTLNRNGIPMLEDDSTDGRSYLENVEFIAEDRSGGTNELPLFVDVIVTISDGGTVPGISKFESRAFMIHRKRYSME